MSVPLIDAQVLQEFLDKAEPLLSEADLRAIGDCMQRRTGALLAGDTDVAEALRQAPATRRLQARDLGGWDDRLREIWPQLRQGDADGALLRLCEREEPPPWIVDAATFWLHAASPAENPWWARWVLERRRRTGAILLLLDDPGALAEGGTAQAYVDLRQAVQFLTEILAATRRLRPVAQPYRATVALAAVYAVYMFTMASWRMTDEFTQVMPPFPGVVASLLGVARREVRCVGGEGEGG